jgi:hypothetical protein
MRTNYSSQETQKRAEEIARVINSNHRSIDFHKIFEEYKNLGSHNLGKNIKFII